MLVLIVMKLWFSKRPLSHTRSANSLQFSMPCTNSNAQFYARTVQRNQQLCRPNNILAMTMAASNAFHFFHQAFVKQKSEIFSILPLSTAIATRILHVLWLCRLLCVPTANALQTTNMQLKCTVRCNTARCTMRTAHRVSATSTFVKIIHAMDLSYPHDVWRTAPPFFIFFHFANYFLKYPNKLSVFMNTLIESLLSMRFSISYASESCGESERWTPHAIWFYIMHYYLHTALCSERAIWIEVFSFVHWLFSGSSRNRLSGQRSIGDACADHWMNNNDLRSERHEHQTPYIRLAEMCENRTSTQVLIAFNAHVIFCGTWLAQVTFIQYTVNGSNLNRWR